MCNVLATLPQPIGRRRQTGGQLCHVCCKGDYCNDNCNATMATVTMSTTSRTTTSVSTTETSTMTTQTTTQSTTTVTTTPTSTPTTILAPVTPGQVLFLDETCPCNNRNLKMKKKYMYFLVHQENMSVKCIDP